ncbi:hypothetical protein PSMK_02860 [Phycisphaera mikurensis NBRC 102666]|uniref:Uncharacterized protein n=1 Tax=Phycisphaera mikurensis (strain NBRC 102666 / KCTC 22515 / FYK2301M01) TaxID=1142394 RepID=I0IB07_PHYMF|nr:hypothetical protein PSMK_02860 [Phycisphaera mikurensis NBRC 102666]
MRSRSAATLPIIPAACGWCILARFFLLCRLFGLPPRGRRRSRSRGPAPTPPPKEPPWPLSRSFLS